MSTVLDRKSKNRQLDKKEGTDAANTKWILWGTFGMVAAILLLLVMAGSAVGYFAVFKPAIAKAAHQRHQPNGDMSHEEAESERLKFKAQHPNLP